MLRREILENTPVPSARVQHYIDGWLDAMLWQRRLHRALRPLGITHTQILVLQGAALALREQRDAVSLADIATERVWTPRRPPLSSQSSMNSATSTRASMASMAGSTASI